MATLKKKDWQQKWGCIHLASCCVPICTLYLYIRPLPSGFPAALSDKLCTASELDVNAAIVSWRATSCRLPGPHPLDVLMIWYTWSKALFVSWCAFCFSRAPTRTGIDLAELHSHCWWMQISSVKMWRKDLNISSVPTNDLSLKWSFLSLTVTSLYAYPKNEVYPVTARLPPGCVARRVRWRLDRLWNSFFPRAVKKVSFTLIHPYCCAIKWDLQFTIQPASKHLEGKTVWLLKWATSGL